ncbi:redox-regulated ATPase YchF [Candidatus Riflebacteria bacterium]
MGLNCGLIGLPGCGKTTIFNAITAQSVPISGKQEKNQVRVNLPDYRLQQLTDLYQAKKVVPAFLELTDIPGIKPGSVIGGGRGAKLLSNLKEADALIHVINLFENDSEPGEDIETIDLELIVADSETLNSRIEKLSRLARKDQKIAAAVKLFKRVLINLEDGIPARKQEFTEAERQIVHPCQLVSQKPVLYVANLRELHNLQNPTIQKLAHLAAVESAQWLAISGRDEEDISQMEPRERMEFMIDMGLKESSLERLIQAAYKMLGLVNFFTAGENEVHAWTCKKGDTAPVAAGKIHSDMEKGFIKMEVIKFNDMLEYGSESSVAKAGKLRLEGKVYRIEEGDIVVIRFSPS